MPDAERDRRGILVEAIRQGFPLIEAASQAGLSYYSAHSILRRAGIHSSGWTGNRSPRWWDSVLVRINLNDAEIRTLKPHSERVRRALRAVQAGGTIRAASETVGLPEDTIRSHLWAVVARASIRIPRRVKMGHYGRKPEGSIKIDQTSRWGSPFVILAPLGRSGKGWKISYSISRPDRPRPDWAAEIHAMKFASEREAAEVATESFRRWLVGMPALVEQARKELRGRDLACWCEGDMPCHGDVWLEVANTGEGPPQNKRGRGRPRNLPK